MRDVDDCETLSKVGFYCGKEKYSVFDALAQIAKFQDVFSETIVICGDEKDVSRWQYNYNTCAYFIKDAPHWQSLPYFRRCIFDNIEKTWVSRFSYPMAFVYWFVTPTPDFILDSRYKLYTRCVSPISQILSKDIFVFHLEFPRTFAVEYLTIRCGSTIHPDGLDIEMCFICCGLMDSAYYLVCCKQTICELCLIRVTKCPYCRHEPILKRRISSDADALTCQLDQFCKIYNNVLIVFQSIQKKKHFSSQFKRENVSLCHVSGPVSKKNAKITNLVVFVNVTNARKVRKFMINFETQVDVKVVTLKDMV